MAEVDDRLERRAARRRYERAARTYEDAARLEAEVGARMLERLDYVRIEPRRVLDAGAGTAREARRLAERYPTAAIVALDFSVGMLRRARRAQGFLSRVFGGRRPLVICADMTRLPVAAGAVGLVWSNMALHALDEPLDALREFQRVLAPEGLLMFSTLGPDTLKELRAVAGARRVHRFMDMHDLGDRLVAAGFAAPVMDMELITVTYPSSAALLGELRATGQTSVRVDRLRGLAGRRFLAQLHEGLAAQMDESRLPVTFEVVYGHAWKGTPRAAPGAPAVVRLERARHKKS
ncbi:MAG TPA: methyltransferase domain-containing protein [Burkholderiales bacterium]|nr:methyltransferase domain-containing protein [Burkholderiales bacterium]